MCGIVGIFGTSPILQRRVQAALNAISHRGPDGEGIFEDDTVILGHRRLAIIDLTSGGHQPMVDPQSGAVISFNGEIYNFVEVRRDLEAEGVTFRSNSDTEVLLQAWLHWREDAFRRLNGMWAFAIWDPRRQELLLARDRFGVKPLYWAISDGALLFGSEPKALLAMAPALAEANPQAIYNLIVDSRSQDGSSTYLKHVQSLPPASYAIVKRDCLEPVAKRYWDYPQPAFSPRSPKESLTEFSDIFEDAVRLRLRSDVPVGLTLSGGLDSSAILAATAVFGTPLQALTSVYSATERGEESWAEIAAQSAGANLQSVTADSGNWAETLEQIVWHMDGPGYTPAVFPLWAIMKHARQEGIPVLLEGQGADELLAGYPQYVARLLLSQMGELVGGKSSVRDVADTFNGLMRVTPPIWAVRWLARMGLAPLADRFGPRRKKLELVTPIADICTAAAMPDVVNGHDAVRTELLRDHQTRILPALLQYGDAVSMAHGIEARLPFMDYRLVEWVFRSQPPLIVQGRTKEPVRRYLNSRGMSRIAARADKQGYPTPTRSWLSSEAGRNLISDMLGNASAPIWNYIDRGAATRLAEAGIAGNDISLYHFYKLVSCHIWLNQLSGHAASNLSGSSMSVFRPVSKGL